MRILLVLSASLHHMVAGVISMENISSHTLFGPLLGTKTTKEQLERPTETAYVWELFDDGRQSQVRVTRLWCHLVANITILVDRIISVCIWQCKLLHTVEPSCVSY